MATNLIAIKKRIAEDPFFYRANDLAQCVDDRRALCDELEQLRADGIALRAAENALTAIAALQPQPEDNASRCVESLLAAVGFARQALTTIGAFPTRETA